MKNTRTLERIGLSKKEAKVYISLLKLKLAPVTKISEDSEVDRTQTYDLLQGLVKRGLAAYVLKNNTKHFSPANPEVILHDLEEREKEFRAALPTLKQLFAQQSERTSVEIFRGIQGLKAVYKNLLKSNNDYLLLGTPQRFEKILPIFSKQFLMQAEKAGIQEKIIFSSKEKFTKLKKGKYKYLKQDIFNPTDALIYNGHVILFVWLEPYYAIMIQSKAVEKTYRKYFDFLWQHAKSL
ncbi:hypothetical protein HYW21_08525 [Candidatus Woesearchaeota archaeon]|nr:hypothetical protein [Candidatus Woesearchaeota archaeon]